MHALLIVLAIIGIIVLIYLWYGPLSSIRCRYARWALRVAPIFIAIGCGAGILFTIEYAIYTDDAYYILVILVYLIVWSLFPRLL